MAPLTMNAVFAVVKAPHHTVACPAAQYVGQRTEEQCMERFQTLSVPLRERSLWTREVRYSDSCSQTYAQYIFSLSDSLGQHSCFRPAHLFDRAVSSSRRMRGSSGSSTSTVQNTGPVWPNTCLVDTLSSVERGTLGTSASAG